VPEIAQTSRIGHERCDVPDIFDGGEQDTHGSSIDPSKRLAGAMVRAMTDPPKRPRPAKTVMNVRSAEGAVVTAIARRRSNQLRSRTSASGTKRQFAVQGNVQSWG
jgi:hypothetical protein